MSQNKNLKFGWIFVFTLIFLNILLVFIVPQKPASVEKISFPDSPIDAQIKITFSQAMNKASVQDNFKIEPPIEGNFSWSGRTLVYTPLENLAFDKTYNLEIGSKTVSDNGISFAKNWEDTFKTGPLSFFFISIEKESYGQLQQYLVKEKKVIPFSPKGKVIRDFDYDKNTRKIVALVDGTNEILIIDSGSPKIQAIPPFGNGEEYIHRVKWLPYENSILLSQSNLEDEAETKLLRYDLEEDGYTVLEKGSTLVYEFFPTPDGRGVLFIDPSGALVIKSLSDHSATLVTEDFLQHFGFSEYGGYLLYTISTPNGIFDLANSLIIQNSLGEKDIILQNANITIDQASVSPDEKKIIFLHKPQIGDPLLNDENDRLAEMTLEDKNISLLTPENFPVSEPKYSPDGNIISFINSDSSGWNIMQNKLNGGLIYLSDMISTGIHGTNIEWVY